MITHLQIQAGGTLWGQSLWRDLVYGCPRRALLGRIKTGPRKALSGDVNLDVGSVYHHLRNLYHTTKETIALDELVITDETDEEIPEWVREPAVRMFRAYRAEHRPNALGRIIGSEIYLPGDAKQTRALRKLGFPEYTCQIDLVIKITAKDVTRIRRDRKIRVTPGYWLDDIKTMAYYNAARVEQLFHSLQFKIYMLAFQAAYPDRKIKGLIIDMATKTKEPSFPAHTVPPPTPADRKIISRFATLATEAWDAWGGRDFDPQDAPPNPDRCFDYNRRCKYFNNPCKRF